MSKLSKMVTLLFLGVALGLAPIRVVFAPDGSVAVGTPLAFAKDGDDGDDEDGDDDGDDDEGDDGDDGEDDDGDDGEDDDGDDGEDDDGDDGEDDDGDDGEDDDGDDDDEASDSSRTRGNSEDDSGSYKPSGTISRIEVSSSGIEIRYANGAREEIKNGRYLVRDETGKRVVQRRATGPDVVRLRALSERVSIRSVVGRRQAGSAVESVRARKNAITVTYQNGWTETLRGNTYTLTDPYDRTVAMRPATREDTQRLSRIAQQNR